MSKLLPHRVWVVALALCLAALPLGATTLLQMNLEELCDRADKVVDVTIVGFTTGTLSVGGADLPTVTYQARVNEPFKGTFVPVKDGDVVLEFTMVGTLKQGGTQVGGNYSFGSLPNLPDLEVGGQYILMTTPPSAVGLSTTVGLGQGAFRVYEESKVEMVVNEFDNSGLFNGMGIQAADGAITRDELVVAIQAAVAN